MSTTSYNLSIHVIEAQTQNGIANASVQLIGATGLPDQQPFRRVLTNGNGIVSLRFTDLDLMEYYNVSHLDPSIPPFYFRIFLDDSLVHDTEQSLRWQPSVVGGVVTAELQIPIDQRDTRFRVYGRILRADGTAPERTFVVRAFHCGVLDETELGLGQTDTDGSYEIEYLRSHLPDGLRRAHLVVRLFPGTSGEAILSSPLILDADIEEEVNLVVESDSFTGLSEYEQIAAAINPHLPTDSASLDRLEEKSVVLLAQLTNIHQAQITYFIKAQQLERQTQLLSPMCYALFRMEAPASIPAFFGEDPDIQRKRLTDAVEQHVIGEQFLAQIDEFLGRFQQLAVTTELSDGDKPEGNTRDLLNLSQLSDRQKQRFLELYVENTNEMPMFWERVRADDDLGESAATELQELIQLGLLTLNFVPLVNRLRPRVPNARATAQMRRQDWRELIDGIGIPDGIKGRTNAQRRQNYISILQSLATQAYPTTRFLSRWTRDNDVNRGDVETFFQNNPDLELSHTSVRQYIDGTPEALRDISDQQAVVAELQTLERLFRLVPEDDKFETAKVLYQTNMRSAYGITRLGKSEFLRRVNGNLEEEQALQLYARASQRTAMALSTLVNFHPNYYFVNPAVIGSLVFPEAPDDIPNWATLFGSLDYCECTHCHSVLSPAAYFVDLLRFLENASAGNRAALTELLERRPDIGHILLNCENTNTAMPYIDLVNEVLENAVVNGPFNLATAPAFQTRGTTPELRANPEHILSAAYETLTEATFPWSLPFNLWHAEREVYLGQMGIRVDELMDIFHREGESPEAIDRAAAYLGMTLTERQRITNTQVNHNLTGSDAVLTIMARSQTGFDELQALLTSQYINPNGRDVTFADESCALEDARLALTTAERRRMYRFRKLQLISEFSVEDLDHILEALPFSDMTEDFLLQLAYVKRLQERFDLSVADLLSWWSPISVRHYEEEDSFYQQLFLNATVNNPLVSVFELNDDRTEVQLVQNLFNAEGELDEELTPLLLGSLNITAEALRLIIEQALPEPVLNYANLSQLYRIASFSRALGVDIADFFTLTRLMGQPGITAFNLPDSAVNEATPATTWQFVEQYTALQAQGVSIDELSWLLEHRFDPDFRLPLDDNSIALLLDEWQRELRKLYPGAPSEPEQLDTYLMEKLPLIVAEVDTALAIIHGESALSDADQLDFIETNLGDVLEASQLVGPGSISNLSDRLRYSYTRVAAFLARNMIIQQIASHLSLEVSVSEALLRNHLHHPDDASVAAIEVFLSTAFIYNDTNTHEIEAYADVYRTLYHLAKVAFIIQKLSIPAEEVGFVFAQAPALGWYDLTALPVAVQNDNLQLHAWMRLVESYRLNQRLFAGDLTVVSLLRRIQDDELDRDGLLALLSEQTGWERNSVEFLAGPGGYAWNFPDDFQNETWLMQLERAFNLIDKAGTTAAHIWSWNQPEANETLARHIKNAVKARYSNEQWLQVAPELSDPLRIRRRDALRDFLLAQHSQFRDSDDLYTHLLIDTEMEPCFLTSRIKQAISSVQLFVQRVLMGLEPTVRLDADEAAEWQWRKNYRVWEAGRKVFLFPENFTQPELLDDKSPLMQELEETLLQEEVNASSVERAYLRYIRGLDEVARLEIAGLYNDATEKVLHIFARTPGSPPVYYYRKWVDESFFTPWEKVPISIEGNHLIPVVYNRRLWLLWPTFTDQTVEPSTSQLSSDKAQKPRKYHRIFLNWSEYREGKWSSPKKSTSYISTKTNLPSDHRDFEHGHRGRFYFWAETSGENLNVFPFFHYPIILKIGLHEAGVGSYWQSPYRPLQPNRYFRFAGCGDEPKIIKDTSVSGALGYHYRKAIPYRVSKSNFKNYMKFRQSKTLSVFSKISVDEDGLLLENSSKVEVPLTDAPDEFYITPPHQYLHFESNSPFFYEDRRRTFFVIPEKVYDSGASGGGGFGGSGGSTGPGNRIRRLLGNQVNIGVIQPLRATFISPSSSERDNTSSLIQTGRLASRVFTRTDSNQVIHRGSTFASLVDSLEDEREENDTESILSATIPALGPFNIGDFQSNFTVKTGYHFRTFYHPYTCLFIEQINRFGVEGLLKPEKKGKGLELYRQLTPNSSFKFSAEYGPSSPIPFRSPKEDIDFAYEGAYSQYNWELFFHIPMMIADRLSQNQRFAEAQQWYHYIFDPTETDDEESSANEQHRKFWKIRPFYEFRAETTLQELMELINQGNPEYEKQIMRWEADPFNPHLLARLRIVAYMKCVVMKYLDNLIAWADHLFRQDSIESINEGTQLYVLAGQILGRRPVEVPRSAPDARDFDDLQPNLDAFSNALVQLENEITISLFNQFRHHVAVAPQIYRSGNRLAVGQSFSTLRTARAANTLAPIFGYQVNPPDNGEEDDNPWVLYFCLPHNDKLLGYWDIVADRLFKIRNCQNIEGVTRSLALFQPPIDPALLVKAAAAGADLSSALNDLNAPLPYYRFSYMLQKANEFVNDVKALGSALVSALEKKDAEELAVIRAGHEVNVLKSLKYLRQRAIDEAKLSIESLEKSKDTVQVRLDYYRSRPYTNINEQQHLLKLEEAFELQTIGQGYDLAANIAFLFPDAKFGVQGISSPEVTFTYGGSFFGRAFQAFSTFFKLLASVATHQGNRASIKGGYDRRQDDWVFQGDVAEKELEQIDAQIAAAQVRLAIAERELQNQDLQIEQSESVAAFMQEKYTNQQLYGWMIGQITGLYFQSYQMAYDLAKRTEQCLRYELGLAESNFIQFGYWDSLKKGLLAGEKLQKDLRRMEMAYLEQNRREYELTKHVSLAMLNPIALLNLKEEGRCEIELPEALFDLDYPGHYFRRIKSVSITIPAVTGPYTTLSCTLRLLRSSIRRQSTLLNGQYARDLDNDDSRFSDSFGAIQSIATSSGQNDSGLFELNFRDERYLPFEGAGVDSRWQLEMPNEFRQFDYDSISDVILHINYTAREGGAALGNAATQHLLDGINAMVTGENASGLHQPFGSRHEFPTEFHRFLHPPAESEQQQTLTLNLTKNRFPYMFKDRAIIVDQVHVFVQLTDEFRDTEDTDIVFTLVHPEGEVIDLETASSFGNLRQVSIDNINGGPGEWSLTVSSVGNGLTDESNQLNPNAIKDIIFILHYTIG